MDLRLVISLSVSSSGCCKAEDHFHTQHTTYPISGEVFQRQNILLLLPSHNLPHLSKAWTDGEALVVDGGVGGVPVWMV